MSTVIPTDKMSDDQIMEKIEAAYVHWNDIYQNGCFDPCWEDGVNLNLVRNHIIYYYYILDERAEEPEQLSLLTPSAKCIARRPLPPEVDDKYMAKPDELLAGALRTRDAIRSDENYQWIISLRGKLSKNVEKRSCFIAVANYVNAIDDAIQKRHFPRLRSYQDPGYWITAYVGMRKRIEEAIAEEQEGLLTSGDDE